MFIIYRGKVGGSYFEKNKKYRQLELEKMFSIISFQKF